MTTYLLPTSTEAADVTLAELGALATATEWKRAAIVAALVLPHGQRLDPDCNSAIRRVTANQFSKRGIHGLTSPHTVAAYRNAWHTAVDAGLTQPAALGAEVELPGVPWSKFRKSKKDNGIGSGRERDDHDMVNGLFSAVWGAYGAVSRLRWAVDEVASNTSYLAPEVGSVGALLSDIAELRQRLDVLELSLWDYRSRHSRLTPNSREDAPAPSPSPKAMSAATGENAYPATE